MSAMKDPLEVSFLDAKGEGFARQTGDGAASARSQPRELPAAATARLEGFDERGQAVISLATLPGDAVSARSTVPLTTSHVGATVVVVFEEGDVRRPIVLGVLKDRALTAGEAKIDGRHVEVEADDDCVRLSAERQITLSCGEASITLTRAGKVIIKGAYVVSRSTGHNKIKGAVVDIN